MCQESRWSKWSLDRSRMSFSQMGTASGEVVLLCSCLQFPFYKDANGFSSEFLTPPIVSLIHLNSCFCERNDSLRVISVWLSITKAVHASIWGSCLQSGSTAMSVNKAVWTILLLYPRDDITITIIELGLKHLHWTFALFFHPAMIGMGKSISLKVSTCAVKQ